MQINDTEELELKKTALELRKNVLRMIKAGGSGHAGGALSMTEVATALMFKIMKLDPKPVTWPGKLDFAKAAFTPSINRSPSWFRRSMAAESSRSRVTLPAVMVTGLAVKVPLHGSPGFPSR